MQCGKEKISKSKGKNIYSGFLKFSIYISVEFFSLWLETEISLAENNFIKQLNNSSLRSALKRKSCLFHFFYWVKGKQKEKYNNCNSHSFLFLGLVFLIILCLGWKLQYQGQCNENDNKIVTFVYQFRQKQ